MSNLSKIVSFSALLTVVMAATTDSYSAYRGHADDSNINAVLAAYPSSKVRQRIHALFATKAEK
jgi:hypothetical protein